MSRTRPKVPDDPHVILRLMTLLSPSFPTGSFAYSHGFETAIQSDLIHSSRDVESWITGLIKYGSGYTDSIFCALTWKNKLYGSGQSLTEAYKAMAISHERYRESIEQGRAFLEHARIWDDAIKVQPHVDYPHPIAIGSTTRILGIPLKTTLIAFLQTFVSNILQSVLRLGVIGQSAAVSIQNALEPEILNQASFASEANWEDISSFTVHSDILAMQHETLSSRIFKS